MKESNILAGNATFKQLQKEVWLNTRGEYMKESNIFASNVIKNISIVESINSLEIRMFGKKN